MHKLNHQRLRNNKKIQRIRDDICDDVWVKKNLKKFKMLGCYYLITVSIKKKNTDFVYYVKKKSKIWDVVC